MFGLTKFGSGIGLQRLLRYCEASGIDLDSLSSMSIVITGSKGKGSTARFAYEALRTILPRTAVFVSPHLNDVSERYEFAGERMTRDAFETYKARVLTFADMLAGEGERLGEFELLFLVALEWFRELEPDCIVWEAGIGGRYDAVRVLRAPLAALTSVELEHAEILGSTRELIAFDKLDAAGPGGEVIVSSAVGADLYPRLAAFARVSGRDLYLAGERARIERLTSTKEGTSYRLVLDDGESAEVVHSLVGDHQAANSATALVLARQFLRARGRQVSLAELSAGLRSTVWPGRLERISTEPEIWIDVGHTPESVRAACDMFLRLNGRKGAVAIFGVSQNKAVAEISNIVAERFDEIFLTRARKNGLSVGDLAAAIPDAKIVGATDDIVDAVADIRKLLARGDRTVLVVGGLFLAAEFAFAWRGGDPSSLVFF